MIKSKKTWLASVIGAFAVFALSVIAIPSVLRVKADSPADISTASLEMEPGSSLKYNDKGGLRYMVSMDGTTKDLIVNNEAVKLYFVITSKAVFDEYTEKIGTNYADMRNGECIKVEVAEEKIYKVENAYYANGVIGNVTVANRNTDLVSIAYITNGTDVKYATVNGKTVENVDFSIDLMKGNVCKVANALIFEDTDDADKILTNSNYEWFGSEDYPIVVDSSEKYDTLIDKINASNAFKDKSVQVSSGVTTTKEITNTDNTPLISREFLINSEDDFISFISDTTKYTENDIIKLTADLDFDGFDGYGDYILRNGDQSYYFYGTFDGQNHSVSNFDYGILSGKGGIFSNLGGRDAEISGHVKNLALLNCNINNEQYFVAGNIFYQSTIENVYVQGTNTGSNYGIARLSDEGAKIINCLANITFGNTNGTAYGDGTAKNLSTLENCYAITDAKTAPDGTNGLTEPYASVNAFIQANPTFGEGGLITVENNGICFAGKAVAAIYTVQHKLGDTVFETQTFDGTVGAVTAANSLPDCGYVCIDAEIGNKKIASDGSTVVVINYADYPELLQFDTDASLKLVKSGNSVSLVDDAQATDGTAVQATARRDTPSTPVTINLGGKYKVSEIAGIQITYKITGGSYSDTWVGIYVNEQMSDYNTDRISTIHYTGMSDYAKQTITQSNLLEKLGKDDYVTALSIIEKDSPIRQIIIRIDSIKIIPFSEALQFNSEESKVLVTSGSSVSLVDDAQATDGKAVQAKTTRSNSTTYTPFTINLGGKYKVSEIEEIRVRYKITAASAASKIMCMFINGLWADTNTYRIASKYLSGATSMSAYETATISQDKLKTGNGATLLGDDDFVESISFMAKDYVDFTVCIDSIEIILK